MHQNAFGDRDPPGPAGGVYSSPPDPLAVLRTGVRRGRRGGDEKEGRQT